MVISTVMPCAFTPAVPGPPACASGAPAVREVRAVAEGIVAADNDRDIDRVLGYYAPDAVLMPPGEDPVKGLDAIRPRYQSLFARFKPEIEPGIDEACAGEKLAFVRGRNGGQLVSIRSGEARPLNDVYLMLLRRSADGAWRITHLIWHRGGSREDGPPGR